MRRGEVWWATLPPPIGRRPVLLLSRNESYDSRDQIVIALVTTRIRNIPAEVVLGITDGMPRISVVNLDALFTTRIANLQERIAVLSHDRLLEIEAALHFALELET